MANAPDKPTYKAWPWSKARPTDVNFMHDPGAFLPAVGHAAGNIGHALATGINAIPDALNPFGADKGKSAPTATPDYEKILAGIGIDPEGISQITSQINQGKNIAGLPAELQPLVQNYYAQKNNASAAPKNFIDPMTMQLFFATQVAPYMQQFGKNNEDAMASMYDTESKQLSSANINPMMKALLGNTVPQEKAAYESEAQANKAAIPASATLDAILQQLANSQQTQLQYAADLRNQVAQSSLGTLLGGTAGTAATPFTKPAGT